LFLRRESSTSSTTRISKMNPSAARRARPSDRDRQVPARSGRRQQPSVRSAAGKPLFPLNLPRAVRFIAVSASSAGRRKRRRQPGKSLFPSSSAGRTGMSAHALTALSLLTLLLQILTAIKLCLLAPAGLSQPFFVAAQPSFEIFAARAAARVGNGNELGQRAQTDCGAPWKVPMTPCFFVAQGPRVFCGDLRQFVSSAKPATSLSLRRSSTCSGSSISHGTISPSRFLPDARVFGIHGEQFITEWLVHCAPIAGAGQIPRSFFNSPTNHWASLLSMPLAAVIFVPLWRWMRRSYQTRSPLFIPGYSSNF